MKNYNFGSDYAYQLKMRIEAEKNLQSVEPKTESNVITESKPGVEENVDEAGAKAKETQKEKKKNSKKKKVQNKAD